MKLYNEITHAELHINDETVTFRGERVRITGMEPPRESHKSGYVSVDFIDANGRKKYDGRYYPGVINAKFR